jgi:GTPase SAR1 family protein
LKDYYQSTEGETEFLYEAKMVLVGNGRVGKTTISKNIIGNYGIYDNEESTHGIEVRKWDCKFSKEDLKTLFSRLPPQVLAANVNWTKLKNEGFRLNIWDFGGQGKYRAVQQFFCSRNSLYLYVTSVDDEFINKNDVYINFSYWIPFISTFGFNQSQNHKSPVIYIYNKTDKIQGSGLEKKKRIKDQVEVASKGESFVNVSDVIDISCNNAKDIEALRTQIRQILPFISDDVFTRRYGKGWLDTKQELESLNEAFIFKERYVSIFKINVRKYQELALVEEESQAETWLTVLDAIGSVIYFSEEKVKIVVQEDNKKPVHLSQIVILQPEWLKEIAYEVLNCEVVINRRGEFDAHDFDKIWPKVAPQQYDLLIQMMLAFELCYHSDKFGREIYVVPALFPEQTPLDYQQQGFEELAGTNIVQKYVLEFSPFMPAGVLHKLVIAKNGWIYQEIKWLTGVVLHGKNTYIEITEQWDKSTITLMIAGERPDWMRDDIINEIRRITDSVRSTKYLYELKFDVKRINPMEKPGNTMVPIRVFISYSHAYKEYYQVFKDKFETGTKPLQHNGNYKIEIYSDEQIPLGSNWHTELQREVLNCDIAILLISDTFFTSEYIRQQELNRFIDRHNNNQILIVPIYFHPCDYDSWGKLQEIQFFKPEGAKYGRPELGTSFSFSDLVNFYSANGQLMVTPNLNISRYMTDMVNKLKPEFARIASKKIEQ